MLDQEGENKRRMPPSEHHHPVIFVFLNQCPGLDLHQNTDYTVILENRGEHVHAGEFMRKVKNIIKICHEFKKIQ